VKLVPVRGSRVYNLTTSDFCECSNPCWNQGSTDRLIWLLWYLGSSVSSCSKYWIQPPDLSTHRSKLIFNGYDVPFNGTFGQAHSDACIEFQQFYKLAVIGAGNYETWLSLLISTGDPERSVTGADCASTVTAARASALYNAGYRAIGRYLSNVSGSSFNKKIQPGELGNIFGAGLRVFPLFETSGDYLEYFHYDQGVEDAKQATSAATLYGFRRGTVIYFAVSRPDMPGYG